MSINCLLLCFSIAQKFYHILLYVINEVKKSKIKIVFETVAEPPLPKSKAYVLCDSCFTNKDVINTYFKKDHHFIATLKYNDFNLLQYIFDKK